ncbi:hypothetical protein [Arsenicicoccus dermatophilus]|uniref:hypothetical protein n=1 Tax=Arsenicicoccus dermatophilus TaxID=1076331 RepID=UPI00391749BB
MAENNRILTAAAVAAAGLVIAGGAAAANASTTPSPRATSSSSAQAGAQPGDDAPGAGTPDQADPGCPGGPAAPGGPGGRGHHGGVHRHTAVTGDELAKVQAAVRATDSSVTVREARKDPDGSYDVLGSKAGSPVRIEVSQDLRTVDVRTGGPREHDGPGRHGQHGRPGEHDGSGEHDGPGAGPGRPGRQAPQDRPTAAASGAA